MPPEPSIDRAWTAALVLILIVMVLNLAARLIYRRFGTEIRMTRLRMDRRLDRGKTIDVTDLNLYYGKFLAVKDVNVTIQPQQGHGADRVLGLRQVDVPALAQPHARAHPRRARRGRGAARRRRTSTPPASTRSPCAARSAWSSRRPNPFPTMSIYDNVAAGLKLNSRKIKKADMDEIVERSLRGANLWEEVKDRLGKPGIGPLRRPAAAPVHRARDRRRARRAADGRARARRWTRSRRWRSRT